MILAVGILEFPQTVVLLPLGGLAKWPLLGYSNPVFCHQSKSC
jgi:hypothetical protein